MRVELRPNKAGWLATSDTKVRARGATCTAALVALKRASLTAIAKDVEEIVEWQEVPRRDVDERDRRVLGRTMKWTKRTSEHAYAGLDARTLAWLIEQRFVLAEQDTLLARTPATVLAALASNPGSTASGFLVGPHRADCRLEIEALVDARGQPLAASQLPENLYETVIERVVELSIDKQDDGWRYRSKGGIVDGVATSLARARHDAASRAWAALAVRLADEDLSRTAIMRIEFAVTGAPPRATARKQAAAPKKPRVVTKKASAAKKRAL